MHLYLLSTNLFAVWFHTPDYMQVCLANNLQHCIILSKQAMYRLLYRGCFTINETSDFSYPYTFKPLNPYTFIPLNPYTLIPLTPLDFSDIQTFRHSDIQTFFLYLPKFYKL